MKYFYSIIQALLIFAGLFLISDTALAGSLKVEDMDSSEKADIHVSILLERVYLDGEMSEETVDESIISMEEFWDKYQHWQLVDVEDGTITFQKRINDISPLLKSNGYFGLSEDGTLSIFNGKPDQSNLIQSFFQIDMRRLESSTQKKLMNGIPIKNKYDYTSVLETYRPLSIN
ncbi:intercompartmental signaling factor BofC [Falsibacillus pallidus]|uniref:Forespore regulator of the sigma-K checkpoint n=1 Tax=Falsibacillus pallidus TaxID=493781 RepID=A0A370GLI7_9BACI|nr:intercompartmental signaling factor BofC [Falsibacillus pallidus]RDI44126.1 forespore regulator of the sigma-K checkpoint [Falsibacillus pallidus]